MDGDTEQQQSVRRELLSSPQMLRLRSFHNTIRVLQLDHSNSWWGFLSWLVAALLIVLVPILKVLWVQAADDKNKLVFQQLVTLVGALTSSAAFLFVNQTIRTYGLRGILFLDAAAEEVADVQKEYQSAIEAGQTVLAKLFFPALVLYALQRSWLYSQIELKPLPLGLNSRAADLVLTILASFLSWSFQTTTYLYTCVLFWNICVLQELKMRKFKELLGKKLDPEFYYHEYTRIIRGIQATSRRFRMFLALIGIFNVFCTLASMYEIVEASRKGVTHSFYMAGELLVLNMVNLTGLGLCLKSASRIAHLHRRVVRTACAVHAVQTFEAAFSQEACLRRLALVTFLSQTTVGISVYGFILDRFFVHTSIGAILTTTWFILGRSLL